MTNISLEEIGTVASLKKTFRIRVLFLKKLQSFREQCELLGKFHFEFQTLKSLVIGKENDNENAFLVVK